MTNRVRERVDADPGAHSFLDALATVSFTLACGCYVGHAKEPAEAMMLKRVGATYECGKHGLQIITKANQRLVGWNKPPSWRR